MTTKQLEKKVNAIEEADETTQVSLPNNRKVSRIEKNAIASRDEAKKIKVNSVASYNAAAEFALTLKEAERSVGELYDEHCQKAHELHKGLTSARKKLLDPIIEARKIVESAMSSYDREQRRLATEKAQKEAEEERQREIAAAKKSKDAELVKELKATPVVVDPVMIQSRTPVVAGILSKPVIKWRLKKEGDINLVPRKFLCLDERALTAYVKAHGMDSEIAGIEVYSDVQTQIRG